MSAAASPSEAPVSGRGVHGVAEVGFAGVGTASLRHLYQRDPMRVLFPAQPAAEPPLAALVTTSGGLVCGDRIDVTVSAADGASAIVAAQAAEKVYRSTGPDCLIDVRLEAAEGTWLEWLPQETILFDQARLRRRVRIDRAPGGRVLAGEFLVLGRIASGERMTRGLVREAWEVRRNGDLVWADALHVEDDLSAVLDHPAGFGGARAVACAVYAADDAPARQQEARRLLDDLPAGVRAGATVVNGVLVVRWLAERGDDVRCAFATFWAGFRATAAGLAAALPRLWHV